MIDPVEKIKSMSIWQGEYSFKPLSGGLTNHNYLLEDESGQYVVRLGDDILEHQLMRFNELAASRAAHAAGLSPKVVHAEPGVLVLEYIRSKTLSSKDVQNPHYLEQIVPLVKACHLKIPKFLRGPSLVFWPFHVLRDYGWTLREGNSVHLARLPDFQKIADNLEQASGPFDLVYGHNDLLAANFLDDGERLWLLDWDYAGFNSPLFDLGGLSSNNGFDEAKEKWLLEAYFEAPVSDDLWRRYQAMKCASLLRETMWSMVSEVHSKIDYDYNAYSLENLARFEQAYGDFTQL